MFFLFFFPSSFSGVENVIFNNKGCIFRVARYNKGMPFTCLPFILTIFFFLTRSIGECIKASFSLWFSFSASRKILWPTLVPELSPVPKLTSFAKTKEKGRRGGRGKGGWGRTFSAGFFFWNARETIDLLSSRNGCRHRSINYNFFVHRESPKINLFANQLFGCLSVRNAAPWYH